MHNYEVKFLVRVYVSTESADLSETAARIHCSVEASVDPGKQQIEMDDCVVEWLEADECDDDGEIIRAIDTAGERDVD